jgi:CopG antitoxin of type II toxin-antitoxin system
MKKELPEKEFTERFDAGEDPRSLGFDLENAVVEQPEAKRVNVDLPASMLARLDREAQLRGITRQSLIKVWLYERLEAEKN